MQGAIGECGFIEQELNHKKAIKILDVRCGTRRHSVELAKRGYSMTRIDLSASQLKWAEEKAKQFDLAIDFQQQDARGLPVDKEFDAAIILCEGGGPLMETDKMNFEILKNVTKTLKDTIKAKGVTHNYCILSKRWGMK